MRRLVVWCGVTVALCEALLLSLLPTRALVQDPTVFAMWGQPAGHTATGPAVDGFALSLTTNATQVHLGDLMWINIELRNVSGRANSTYFGSRGADYEVTIVLRRFRESKGGFTNPAVTQCA